MDQISQKSSLNKKIGVKLGNVIFPPLLDHLTEHQCVMWSLSYRADHDNHPGKFVDGIFSINEVSHSMDSWFLRKVLEKAIKLQKKNLQVLRKVFQVHPLSSHMPSMGMENKNWALLCNLTDTDRVCGSSENHLTLIMEIPCFAWIAFTIYYQNQWWGHLAVDQSSRKPKNNPPCHVLSW